MIRIAEIYRSLQGEGRLTGIESVFVRTSGCNLRCGFCDTTYASWTPEGDYLSVEQVLAAVDQVAAATAERTVPLCIAEKVVDVGRNKLAKFRQGAHAGTAQACSGLLAASSNDTTLATLAPDGGADSSDRRALRHVVITGGEPMLFPDLVRLCAELRRRGMFITIETAGTRYLAVDCDLMAVSPKLSNSTPHGAGLREWIAIHERNRTATGVVRRLNAQYDCQFKFVVATPADCAEVRAYLGAFPEIDRRRVLLMPMGTKRAELEQVALWLEPYCREHCLTFCPRRHIEWFGCRRGT